MMESLSPLELREPVRGIFRLGINSFRILELTLDRARDYKDVFEFEDGVYAEIVGPSIDNDPAKLEDCYGVTVRYQGAKR